MTTDELIENVRKWPELIQAYREGKAIERYFSHRDEWVADNTPPEHWDQSYRRRIKPEPRFTKGLDVPETRSCQASYRIDDNPHFHSGRIVVYGDESLRDRILDFLNSEDA